MLSHHMSITGCSPRADQERFIQYRQIGTCYKMIKLSQGSQVMPAGTADEPRHFRGKESGAEVEGAEAITFGKRHEHHSGVALIS